MTTRIVKYRASSSHQRCNNNCRFGTTTTLQLLLSLVFFTLISLLAITSAEASRYAQICSIQTSPPVSIEYDPVTGEFTLLNSDDDDDHHHDYHEDTLRRKLSSEVRKDQTVVHVGKQQHGDDASNEHHNKRSFLRANRKRKRHANSRNTSRRILEPDTASSNQESSSSGSSNKKQTYIARSCPCDPTGHTYCLIDALHSNIPTPDSCGVPWSDQPLFATSNNNDNNNDAINSTDIYHDATTSYAYDLQNIGCFELNSQTVFIRNAWPVVVLWYGALTLFLFATSNGKFARAYILQALCSRSTVLQNTNERTVQRIMEHENEMRRRLRGAAIRSANIANGPGRYLVRTRGVRIPARVEMGSNNNDNDITTTNGDDNESRRVGRGSAATTNGMTQEEERQEATRWWLEQAERLGILSEQSPQQQSQPQQPMEYVLRTTKFTAEKARGRRDELRERVIANANASSTTSHGEEQELGRPDSNHSEVQSSSRTGEETCDCEAAVADPEEEEAAAAVPLDNTPEGTTTTATKAAASSTPLEADTNSMPQTTQAQTQNNQHTTCTNYDEQDDDDTFECTICLTTIEEGEQVGVLPGCAHVFHVDCLREWITRKNACPLCQSEIATARPVAVVIEEGDRGVRGGGLDDLVSLTLSSEEEMLSERGFGSSNHDDGRDITNRTRGDNDNDNAQGSRSRPWFMPTFFFPTSSSSSNNNDNENESPQQGQQRQRTSSARSSPQSTQSQSRLSLSPSNSILSDHNLHHGGELILAPSLSLADSNSSDQHHREQRRQRRLRRERQRQQQRGRGERARRR